MLRAREPLFLRCRHDVTIDHEARSRIVIVRRNPEDGGHARTLEQRIDKRSYRRSLREHDQETRRHENDDYRQEPVFLVELEKLPELTENLNLGHRLRLSDSLLTHNPRLLLKHLLEVLWIVLSLWIPYPVCFAPRPSTP